MNIDNLKSSLGGQFRPPVWVGKLESRALILHKVNWLFCVVLFSNPWIYFTSSNLLKLIIVEDTPVGSTSVLQPFFLQWVAFGNSNVSSKCQQNRVLSIIFKYFVYYFSRENNISIFESSKFPFSQLCRLFINPKNDLVKFRCSLMWVRVIWKFTIQKHVHYIH